MAKFKSDEPRTIEINAVDVCQVDFCVRGTTPLISNRFSVKARQQLLLPPLPTNRAERNNTLKHDPVHEFRSAVYMNRDSKRPALFHLPNGMFHKSLGAAALDTPGAKRTQIERLTKIVDVNIDLYGVPTLFMAMVRNSDINKTPDVRTRPMFDEWACKITVQYVRGTLTERSIANLLGAAGQIIGIGDWRGEKGGPYGSYVVVPETDEDYLRIIKTQARKAQQAALDNPICADADSEELLAWFHAEVSKRERNSQLGANSRQAPNDRRKPGSRKKAVLEILSPLTGKPKGNGKARANA